MQKRYSYTDFLSIIQILLSENGCPWDREQTHLTLRQNLIEECYEVVDAINKEDYSSLCEELGDVLLQVVFHSQLAKQEGLFTIDDVIDGIAKKMVFRHPHIFSDVKVENSDEVLQNWDELKKQEKGYKNKTDVLRQIPDCLPAIIRAEKILKKAGKSGFGINDFDENYNLVQDKLQNMLQVKDSSEDDKMSNLGDLLLAVINFSRIFKINCEFCLTNSLKKFINIFDTFEQAVISRGLDIDNLSQDEIKAIINEIKGL